jgi:hypothetical protein
MATPIEQLVVQLYREQLGREADPEGAAYWASRLAGGTSEADVRRAMAEAKEGQDIQLESATAAYRSALGRNPEQAGIQYWLSRAQTEGLGADQLQEIIRSAALREQTERDIVGQVFTNFQSPSLEADPYGGRYSTRSIYDVIDNPENVSYINGRAVQFAAPVTQQMVVSNFGQDGYTATAGTDILNNPVVYAAIDRALASGTMTTEDVNTLFSDLKNVRTAEDYYAALNKPQGQVVIDALRGQQTGEAKTLAEAQAEALQRQAVLDATDQGYYQSNFQLADAYEAAGLDYPFGTEAFQGYDTGVTKDMVLNPQNFNQKINELLKGMSQRFGTEDSMQTPGLGQYYSETGLQPGFTPFGTEGTTFRSGVAGYIPQAQLPTRFDFGAPPVNATFQQYRPGAFQPEGVTTGGFITGYNADGTPIYSTYADPNVNVGGAQSALNPFTPVQAGAISSLQAQIAAMQAATAAAAAAANPVGGG